MTITIEIDEVSGAITVDGSPVEDVEQVCEMLRQAVSAGSMPAEGDEMAEEGPEMDEEGAAMIGAYQKPGPRL